MASAKRMMASARTARRSSCRSLTRRMRWRFSSRRNRVDPHSMRGAFRRLNRWMRIGTAAAARPARKAMFRKLRPNMASYEPPLRLMQARALLDEAQQRPVERRLVGERHEIDELLAARLAVDFAPRRDFLPILLGHHPGLGDDLLSGLEIDETQLVMKREGPLGVVEDLEDDDLVLPVPEVLQPLQHATRIVHEVGDDDDEPPAPNLLRDARQAGADVGAGSGLDILQLAQHELEMAPRRPRRDETPDGVVEQQQADGVLLVEHQEGNGGGEVLAVLELGDRPLARIGHRPAHVEQDVAAEVGL